MDLKQYFEVIKKRWWLITAIVMIAVVATGIKSFYFTNPIYAANAKLIVNQSSGDITSTLNTNTVQTSIILINSYKEIINSSAIMNKVVEKYPDLNKSSAELLSGISVTSSNNSQVMNLVYQDTSYAKAAAIVNAVSTVFKEQIPLIMKIDNITILSMADTTVTPGPINLNPIMNILISMVVSLMLAVGLVFLLDYFDDTLKTEADITEIFEVPVLASVANITQEDLKTITRPKSLEVGDGKYATLNQ
ncbi:YveK family protein [Paenibacillus gallinarum]|uniref:Lipopolysaccharide biosynthesis protein n=1 Tax=Paenibacillus gallinarum TaxID=2762232 RepID=A0ABR8T5C5_9BACL|nr:Wzz/FepE/Etk N-terminal domain-containing protein [Paenibacillus gallinarum]MBD7970804.1 lipopolysaccharide biosynthesis protein [Paenibacillus gallinarum]